MITCMKMKSFILKYASKIMFYAVNIACYHSPIGLRGQHLESNESRIDPMSSNMIINLNMFGALMKCRVAHDEEVSLVVTKHGHGTRN